MNVTPVKDILHLHWCALINVPRIIYVLAWINYPLNIFITSSQREVTETLGRGLVVNVDVWNYQTQDLSFNPSGEGGLNTSGKWFSSKRPASSPWRPAEDSGIDRSITPTDGLVWVRSTTEMFTARCINVAVNKLGWCCICLCRYFSPDHNGTKHLAKHTRAIVHLSFQKQPQQCWGQICVILQGARDFLQWIREWRASRC